MGKLDERLVRYADLKPCLNAFVDTRTPGSDRKENFTIIGPGVAENPACSYRRKARFQCQCRAPARGLSQFAAQP